MNSGALTPISNPTFTNSCEKYAHVQESCPLHLDCDHRADGGGIRCYAVQALAAGLDQRNRVVTAV